MVGIVSRTYTLTMQMNFRSVHLARRKLENKTTAVVTTSGRYEIPAIFVTLMNIATVATSVQFFRVRVFAL